MDDNIKNKAVLIGPVMGELYWEFGRFAPYIIGKRKNKLYDGVKFIVLTRPDRIDIYGDNVDIFVPLEIDGDNTIYNQDCFKLTNFPDSEYNRIINSCHIQFMDTYNIIESIRPNLSANNFADKKQFVNNLKNQISYDYAPRLNNKLLLDKVLLGDTRPLIVLAPRYRQMMDRNWNYWEDLYDRLSADSMLNNFKFIICGKAPDYVPDPKGRFLDINYIVDNKTSLIGLTIEAIRRSILTVGSQSAIPNISLLLGTPVMEWGHQRRIHVIDNNPLDVPIRFIDDFVYDRDHLKILHELKQLLEEQMMQNVGKWDCNTTNYTR